VQTCSLCNSSSSDQATHCHSCHADLTEFSTMAQALKRFQENPRVLSVKILTNDAACSFCYEQLGTYPKIKVPRLPHTSCSHENGCRCFYIPVLGEIYP
jgi:hypothetical protein